MKPTKMTLGYLVVMALTILFDLVLAGLATWVLIGTTKGTMFVPDWFFTLCIVGGAVNAAFFAFTAVYFSAKKK